MKISEIKTYTDKIDGWLSENEGILLYNLAKNCSPKGVIVEIGSWKGKSTIWLGNGSKAGNKVTIHAIDPHIGSSEHQQDQLKVWTFDEFRKNIIASKVNELITPIIKTSVDAAVNFDNPVELIFVDGGHEYELVKLDFDTWFPKVINGGVMAFHDCLGWNGPKKVVEQFVFKSKYFKNLGFVDSITYGQKIKCNSAFDRIRNRYILFLKNACEFAANLKLPKPIRYFGKKMLKLMQF